MNITNNFTSDTNICFLDGISKGFSMLSDFLKYFDKFVINNNDYKATMEKNYENSFNENLVSSFNALNTALTSYQKILQNNELMKIETYHVSEIQDMLSYFFEEDRFKNLSKDEFSFIIDLLESYNDFICKKIKLLNKYYSNSKKKFLIEEKFEEEYYQIFHYYDEVFEKQSGLFYSKLYVAKAKYEKAIKETFNVLGKIE
jgi:hypothetical protein